MEMEDGREERINNVNGIGEGVEVMDVGEYWFGRV
jgi:hypothetical protein